MQGGQGLFGVPDQRLLGDLQGQVPTVETGVAQGAADGVDEVGGDQLGGRDVDAEAERRAVGELLVPCLQLPAAGLDHPPAEFTGQVGGLDQVDEGARWQQTEVGVRPANQRFDAGDVAGERARPAVGSAGRASRS